MSTILVKPRQQYGKSIMGWDRGAKKMVIFDDRTNERKFLYDSRKGIIQGERAYGHYQTMYAKQLDDGGWSFRTGLMWVSGWQDINERDVPDVVKLAALLSC